MSIKRSNQHQHPSRRGATREHLVAVCSCNCIFKYICMRPTAEFRQENEEPLQPLYDARLPCHLQARKALQPKTPATWQWHSKINLVVCEPSCLLRGERLRAVRAFEGSSHGERQALSRWRCSLSVCLWSLRALSVFLVQLTSATSARILATG